MLTGETLKAKTRSEKANNLESVVKNRTTPTATIRTRNYVLLNEMHSLKLQNLLQKSQELNKCQCQLRWL